jgi:hypothetical protein
VESNIAFILVAYGYTYEELHIKDDDGLLVENDEQHDLDINDNE